MIKYMLVLCLAFWAHPRVQGQEAPVPSRPETDRTFKVLLRGGYNISLMKMVYRVPDGTASYEATNGIYLGLAFRFSLGQRWALVPELDYASQGIRWHETLPLCPPIRRSEQHGFINIPLLLQYVSGSGFIPYSGPQAGFWVIYRNQEFTGVDLGWVTGLMYAFSKGIRVDVRYHAGLLNIASDHYPEPLFREVKNRGVQVGVAFDLSGMRKE